MLNTSTHDRTNTNGVRRFLYEWPARDALFPVQAGSDVVRQRPNKPAPGERTAASLANRCRVLATPPVPVFSPPRPEHIARVFAIVLLSVSTAGLVVGHPRLATGGLPLRPTTWGVNLPLSISVMFFSVSRESKALCASSNHKRYKFDQAFPVGPTWATTGRGVKCNSSTPGHPTAAHTLTLSSIFLSMRVIRQQGKVFRLLLYGAGGAPVRGLRERIPKPVTHRPPMPCRSRKRWQRVGTAAACPRQTRDQSRNRLSEPS